jgi:hypothetical protein
MVLQSFSLARSRYVKHNRLAASEGVSINSISVPKKGTCQTNSLLAAHHGRGSFGATEFPKEAYVSDGHEGTNNSPGNRFPRGCTPLSGIKILTVPKGVYATERHKNTNISQGKPIP